MNLKLGSFFNLDNLDSSIEAVGETHELAELLQDQNISSIAPWVSNVAPFLKPLASPEIQLAGELSEAILPFIKIASSFVKYIGKRKEPTTFSQCVVLVCFQAFLEALRKNSEGISISNKKNVSIFKNIKDTEITEEDAKNALKAFPRSKLSEIFKKTIKTRLLQASLDEEVISLLLEKSIWGADPYISYLWGDLPEEIRKFSNISISEWKKESSQDLESDIEKIINEETRKVLSGFTKPEILLGQIYTQLEVEEIDSNGKVSAGQRPASSHSWVNNNLLAGELTKPILIQGDSGQGKSSFCSMYFREVYRKLYPAYIPVLINLREIEDVKETLTKTFEGCLEFRFPSLLRNRQWLSDRTKRYLVLLDGFDEITLEIEQIENLVKRVLDCQRRTQTCFLITGRSLFPQEVEAFFGGYFNVRGAKFCSMSPTLQTDWINKWTSVLANETLPNNFRDFLENCPTDIRDELASQPLSLYLLAQLVQSRKISSNDFIKTKNVYARALIYQRSLDVALETAIKSKSFKSLEKQADLNKDKLKSILSDIAFRFVTSNYKPISISNIKSTLQSSRIIPDVDLSSEHLNLNLERLLNIVLTNFYIRVDKNKGNSYLSFTHRSFSEFLFGNKAKGIIFNLMDSQSNHLKNHKRIFNVFGYGCLTPEISQYVLYHLNQGDAVGFSHYRFEEVFQALYDFYWSWSSNFTFYGLNPNADFECKDLRQSDIYVGINIIILILDSYREIQTSFPLKKEVVSFHLCKNPRLAKQDYEKLLRLIGYSYFLEMENSSEGACKNFSHMLGSFLHKINLSGVKLPGVDLSNSNLRKSIFAGAELSRAKLKGANLVEADFTGANLAGCDFREAKIDRTVFCSANLSGANLSNLNLTKPDKLLDDAPPDEKESDIENLEGVNLNYANLSGAILSGVKLPNAILTNLKLDYANLKAAYLSGSNLGNTSFRKADLQEARFGVDEENPEIDAAYNFEGTDFSGANLEKANFEKVDLTGADFKGANLRHAIFTNAILDSVCLQNADLSYAIFESAYLGGADLQGANLQGAKFTRSSLKGIKHDMYTAWRKAEGLDLANDIPVEWS